jgi:hypothetical protein
LKRLIKLFTVLAVLAGIVGGIWYLEDMRKQSAEESRAAEAAAFEAARRQKSED